MIQHGKFSNQNRTGGESTYDEKFKDENFYYKHEQEYLLSMAKCRLKYKWFSVLIKTVLTPRLMGNVIFGQVIKGMDVARILENVEVKGEKPANLCITVKCGE